MERRCRWLPMLAYLVIREGSKWSDVFRLVPGRTVTIGRAPTNQIVVKDERCSRNHAEIFLTQGSWTIRDLDSRNGTDVLGDAIHGDFTLSPGDVIRIAHTQLAFVHDLSKAFSEGLEFDEKPRTDETTLHSQISDSNVLNYEPTITHRRGQTKFLRPSEAEDEAAIPKVGRASATLCRLFFQMGNEQQLDKVAQLALDGLFESTSFDAGAVMLAPTEAKGLPNEADLGVIATRAAEGTKYHRVSSFLATTVLREGEAVLARNIEDDSMLGSRDSKGEIRSTSVICAPIRYGNDVLGLIHLYTTSPNHVPDPDDLEFTLAVAENMAQAVRNLRDKQALVENLSQTESEVRQLRTRLGAESEIVSRSPEMEKVQQQISRAAPSRATVLIHGESGVGKELVARAMHYSSPRREGPFVCLNCAALSESLLESELFGHERGAFTGATDRKIGKFEAAHNGTLMLDEIGEMSPSIQAKFLRVLEGHQFERVGGTSPIKVDVRVIAATNRDLEKAVSEGSFRRDLFFRLHVLEINVPPLRRRPEDVEAIAVHFLDRFRDETGRRLEGFTPASMELLKQYHWPGNVRELKNVVERAVVHSRSQVVDVEHIVLSNLESASDAGDEGPVSVSAYEPLSLADIEKRHIIATLKATGWNKSRAAGILGIERSTLDRKIRRYEIQPPSGPRRPPE